MATLRTFLLEVRRHGTSATSSASPSVRLLRLSAAPSGGDRSRPPRHQSTPRHPRREKTQALRRLPGARTRTGSHPPTGSRYWPQPKHDPSRLARMAATDLDPRQTTPSPRWRAQARRKKGVGIAEALDRSLQDAVAGDPMTGLKWTHKSTRR